MHCKLTFSNALWFSLRVYSPVNFQPTSVWSLEPCLPWGYNPGIIPRDLRIFRWNFAKFIVSFCDPQRWRAKMVSPFYNHDVICTVVVLGPQSLMGSFNSHNAMRCLQQSYVACENGVVAQHEMFQCETCPQKRPFSVRITQFWCAKTLPLFQGYLFYGLHKYSDCGNTSFRVHNQWI